VREGDVHGEGAALGAALEARHRRRRARRRQRRRSLERAGEDEGVGRPGDEDAVALLAGGEVDGADGGHAQEAEIDERQVDRRPLVEDGDEVPLPQPGGVGDARRIPLEELPRRPAGLPHPAVVGEEVAGLGDLVLRRLAGTGRHQREDPEPHPAMIVDCNTVRRSACPRLLSWRRLACAWL
jgi:hypothetical protein